MRATKPLIWALGILSAFVLTTLVAVQTNLVLAQDSPTFKVAAAAKKAKKVKKAKKQKQTKKAPAAKGAKTKSPAAGAVSAESGKPGRINAYSQSTTGFPITVHKGKKYFTVPELEADGYVLNRHVQGTLWVDLPDCNIFVAYKGSTGEEYDNGYTEGFNVRQKELDQYGEGYPKYLVVPPGNSEYQKGYIAGYHDAPSMATQLGCRVAEVLDPARHDADGWHKKHDDEFVTAYLPTQGSSVEKKITKQEGQEISVEYVLSTPVFGSNTANSNKVLFDIDDSNEPLTAATGMDALLKGLKKAVEAKTTAEHRFIFEQTPVGSFSVPKGEAAVASYKVIDENHVGESIGQPVTKRVFTDTLLYAVKLNPQTFAVYEFTLEDPERQLLSHHTEMIQKFVREKAHWK